MDIVDVGSVEPEGGVVRSGRYCLFGGKKLVVKQEDRPEV